MKRLACLLVLLPALALAQEPPVLRISGANFRPLPLAVTAPLAPDAGARKAGADFDSALMLDLQVLGIFQVLDRKGYLADPKEGLTASSIQFARWADVGAEALVKTQLVQEGNTLKGVLRLFNVGASREELKVEHAVDAAQPRRLAHHFADALYRHYTREPGAFATSRISYVRRTAKGREVWAADWDGTNAQPVATNGINLLPTVVPGSGAVAFTSYLGGQPDLYLARPGEKPSTLVRAGRMATGVAFSPDGKRIAYALAQGEGAQIFVANADGSSPKQVTDTPSMLNSSPSWSPDGRRIAFVSNRFGSPQIFVMNADGSGVERLTYQGNYNQTPAWSPRGDVIAFTARDERNRFDLFLVDVATKKISRLTQDEGNNEEPAFSPNGRLILFTSTRSGSPRLYVMTVEGNNQTPLPVSGGTYLTPAWGRVDAR